MDINYDDNLVDLILRLRVSKLITSSLSHTWRWRTTSLNALNDLISFS